jgi:hypothetical protein
LLQKIATGEGLRHGRILLQIVDWRL